MPLSRSAQHTRVRTLAAKAFTPPRVEILRAHIADIVGELLDAVHGPRTMDVIADFARPLPAIVSCEMLGFTDRGLAPVEQLDEVIRRASSETFNTVAFAQTR